MAYADKCKACSTSVHVTSEDIRRLVDEIVRGGEFKLVPEEIYGERLQQCSTCEFLAYGTTCMQCGCIVQVRALLADKGCSHPKKSKW